MDNDRKQALREAIRRAGHTQATIAAEIGVAPSAISEVVAGRTTGAAIRYAIASVVGHRVADFWPETEPESTAAA